jgi:hypothetical protein
MIGIILILFSFCWDPCGVYYNEERSELAVSIRMSASAVTRSKQNHWRLDWQIETTAPETMHRINPWEFACSRSNYVLRPFNSKHPWRVK